jgi:hypothetical protein
MRSVLQRERTTFVCDVHESGTTSLPNVGGKLRRYSDSRTADRTCPRKDSGELEMETPWRDWTLRQLRASRGQLSPSVE